MSFDKDTFFVVDLDNEGRLEDDLRQLGELWDQDSILFIPTGGGCGVVWGTNLLPIDDKVDPPYGQKNIIDRPIFDKEGQLMTRVSGRPFVFQQVEIEYRKRPRIGLFGEWGRQLYLKRDWRDC